MLLTLLDSVILVLIRLGVGGGGAYLAPPTNNSCGWNLWTHLYNWASGEQTLSKMAVAMSLSAISRKQKFCPTSGLSPSITLANMDMELGKGSTECITIYKGEDCSSEERLHYENPPLWSKNLFGREVGWLIHLQISSSPDCRRNRRKWELRLCLVWREKQFTSEINSWCLEQVGVDSIAVSPFTGLSWSEMRSSVDKNSDWVQRGMGIYVHSADIWYPLRPSQKPPMAISALVQFQHCLQFLSDYMYVHSADIRISFLTLSAPAASHSRCRPFPKLQTFP